MEPSIQPVSKWPMRLTDMTLQTFNECCAIENNDVESMKQALERYLRKCETSVPHVACAGDAQNLLNRKLELFAKLGLYEDVRTMIEKFPFLNFIQADERGATLLTRLCLWPCSPDKHNYCRIMELLALKAPNSVNMRTITTQSTALHVACNKGNVCKVKMLLRCGAHVNLLDNDNYTPLMRASVRGHSHVVLFLLTRGASISSSLPTIPTPLSLATMESSKRTVTILRDGYHVFSTGLRDACKMMANNRGKLLRSMTPLFVARLRESTSFIAEFFIEKLLKGYCPILFASTIKVNDSGKVTFHPAKAIKKLRVNDYVRDFQDEPEAVCMLKGLNEDMPNRLQIDFRNLNWEILLMQGYYCSATTR